MPHVTRTYAQLHLDDLDPRRFEDLMRALLYDFRDWSLEATGPSGGDQGFDARGIERLGAGNSGEQQIDDEDEDGPTATTMRLWAIQCKREQKLPPKKMRSYAEALPDGAYGVVFAATADLSLKARDAFFDCCRRKGYAEIHLWGRSDIADMLYQPKNDHLLFAFYGISLQFRKRSVATELRSRLAIKRKLKKAFANASNILLRDPTDERYPHLDPDISLKRLERGRWIVLGEAGCYSDGVRIHVQRHVAFLHADGVHWDYAETANLAGPKSSSDPWIENEGNRWEADRTHEQWWNLPEAERAWLQMEAVIPYEAIIAIDEEGDECCEYPQLFTTPWIENRPPVLTKTYWTLNTVDTWGGRNGEPDPENRADIFPRVEMTPEEREAYLERRKAAFTPEHSPAGGPIGPF